MDRVRPWQDDYASEEERLRHVTNELRRNYEHRQSSGAPHDSLTESLLAQVIALQAHVDRLKASGR